MRVSIITPSYQQAAYVQECIDSLHEAGYGAMLDHIVVDGGSTDGSKAILERNARKFAWWCSEKDAGQSDAINKGTIHATGDIFSWLNSDDALLPGVLAEVVRAFTTDPDLLVFGGTLNYIGTGTAPKARINDTRDTRALFCDPIVNQPATFWRMDVVRAIGGVDPALRYVMDLELWWQFLFRFGPDHVRFEPTPFAAFRLHDESKTVTQHTGFLREMAAILHGLCMRTENTDVADVIALGYPDRPVLRGIPADPEKHHAIVRDMSVHFLLKWHGHIHTEAEFNMMQALHHGDFTSEVRLLPGMAERWAKARLAVDGITWNRYRVRRKIKHLFR